MSIINIGLQCVRLMRAKASEEFESAMYNCNSLKELRHVCKSREEVALSLKPPIDLLKCILKRLELKGGPSYL